MSRRDASATSPHYYVRLMSDSEHPRERPTRVLAEASWNELQKDAPQWLQPVYEHLRLHNEYLIRETDRAVGVLAPAFLDAALLSLLRIVLRDCAARKTLLRL